MQTPKHASTMPSRACAAQAVKPNLHGDSRVEAQQSLCRLQVDGLQQDSFGLAVPAVIIQGASQVQHDGGVVLVVLLQGGGVQLDGGRDLALGQVGVGQVDGHIWKVEPVHTGTGCLLHLQWLQVYTPH